MEQKKNRYPLYWRKHGTRYSSNKSSSSTKLVHVCVCVCVQISFCDFSYPFFVQLKLGNTRITSSSNLTHTHPAYVGAGVSYFHFSIENLFLKIQIYITVFLKREQNKKKNNNPLRQSESPLLSNHSADDQTVPFCVVVWWFVSN